MKKSVLLLLLPVLVLALGACGKAEVVIYSALDEPHSRPLIEAFEKETGLTVKAHYDQEAQKTVGLVSKIEMEKDNPKCDVFWNNELVHTVRLKNAGLLQEYRSKNAADIPAQWKDPDGMWTGFAARARVFILNEKVAKKIEPDESKWPTKTLDLIDAKWKGQAGIARPLAGTTLTHMAVLWWKKGPDFVKNLWKGLVANEARVATGNANLMRAVGDGIYAFGYTDTDDYRRAELDGKPVRRIFPDQTEGGEIHGALLIPNSVCMIKGAPTRRTRRS